MPSRIEECGSILRGLTAQENTLLVRYLRQRGTLRGRVRDLHEACVRARLCQADLVLACLRLSMISVVEALIGRPITRCPTIHPRLPPSQRAAKRTGDARIVTSTRKPRAMERGKRRLLACELYDRIARARVGMSLEMLMSRGVTRRDIRIAVKRKYIVIG